jgi:nucleoside-diphosphate-sugar epimerase
MRILVTGASGFIGRHTIGHLAAAGHEVIASGRSRTVAHPGIRWISEDIIKPSVAARIGATTKPDILLHLAWTVEAGKFWTDPDNLEWVAASLTLTRACVEAGARRICAVGSCYEYEWPIDGLCIEEKTPTGTYTLYDAAKDSVRRVLASYTAQCGVSFAWARLFNLYGPHEDPARLVASVTRSLLAAIPARTSSGKAIRDYMDVRDAGQALAALTLSEVNGVVNVATGDGIKISEIIAILGRLIGKEELLQFGALPDREEPARIVADVRRLRREVSPVAPRKLEDGLADAVAFWRDRME